MCVHAFQYINELPLWGVLPYLCIAKLPKKKFLPLAYSLLLFLSLSLVCECVWCVLFLRFEPSVQFVNIFSFLSFCFLRNELWCFSLLLITGGSGYSSCLDTCSPSNPWYVTTCLVVRSQNRLHYLFILVTLAFHCQQVCINNSTYIF